MSAQMTGEEMFESLTGFEEVSIGKTFDSDIGVLAQSKPTMFLRALVFVHQCREGLNSVEAKNAAMGMSLKEANAYFLADEDEPMPDEPVTPSGEGDTPVE